MSILSDLLRDVAALFFPPRCPVCGVPLAQGERTVCTLCRTTAPLTGFWLEADNPLLAKCRDMLPVERASGFLYYIHGSGWRELIRGFKYRGAWRTARAMGEWYGRCLKESGLYDGVEVVVPLPLHPVKRCRRGYNQSGVHRRGDRLAAGSGGRPPERPPQAQYGESGPQAAARARPERGRGFRGAPSRTARRAACTAGGRRLHDGQHDAFVRRGDAARRTRMPDQHRGARRLAAGAGGEGVIGN